MLDSRPLGLDETIAFLHRWYRHTPQPHEDPDVPLPDGLPRALDTLYRAFGGLLAHRRLDHTSPFSGQDHLCGPSELEAHQGYVTFAVENQGNWTCRAALGVEAPPVLSDARSVVEEGAQGFEIVNDSLENFLITLCLQEAVMSSRSLVALDDNWAPPPASQPLWLDGIYVHGESEHTFYYDQARDTLAMDYAGWWIASNSLDVEALTSSESNAQVIRSQ